MGGWVGGWVAGVYLAAHAGLFKMKLLLLPLPILIGRRLPHARFLCFESLHLLLFFFSILPPLPNLLNLFLCGWVGGWVGG